MGLTDVVTGLTAAVKSRPRLALASLLLTVGYCSTVTVRTVMNNVWTDNPTPTKIAYESYNPIFDGPSPLHEDIHLIINEDYDGMKLSFDVADEHIRIFYDSDSKEQYDFDQRSNRIFISATHESQHIATHFEDYSFQDGYGVDKVQRFVNGNSISCVRALFQSEYDFCSEETLEEANVRYNDYIKESMLMEHITFFSEQYAQSGRFITRSEIDIDWNVPADYMYDDMYDGVDDEMYDGMEEGMYDEYETDTIEVHLIEPFPSAPQLFIEPRTPDVVQYHNLVQNMMKTDYNCMQWDSKNELCMSHELIDATCTSDAKGRQCDGPFILREHLEEPIPQSNNSVWNTPLNELYRLR